ncbi:hypothetical protein GCM10023086_06850 [Streptomyces venetus]|uniref:Uncharacterized protein n=1 Tax=Streptomyces venetus TaxID=1701086 RepID=A0ABP8F3X4_9ACTN
MTTHCRLPSEMPKSAWAEGRAMFTMVASSTTMSCASAMKTSALQRLAFPLGPGESSVPAGREVFGVAGGGGVSAIQHAAGAGGPRCG